MQVSHRGGLAGASPSRYSDRFLGELLDLWADLWADEVSGDAAKPRWIFLVPVAHCHRQCVVDLTEFADSPQDPDLMPDITSVADIPLGIWGQTFSSHDLIVILLLVLLEGLLSIDNALVLGLLARRVPKPLQKRALTYGLVGAFVFRVIAISTASFLLKWRIVKLIGGGYLIYIAVKHMFFESQEDANEKIVLDSAGEPELRDAATGARLTDEQEMLEIRERVPVPIPEQEIRAGKSFWMAVLVIELTDIAFAVDSILAAIALVGGPPAGHPQGMTHPKLWVVITGGLLGVVLMRIAAAMFIRLLEKFPRFEMSAYLLVIVIGLKLLADWGLNSDLAPNTIDFHSFRKPEFWIFWISMAVCLGIGFLPKHQLPAGKIGG